MKLTALAYNCVKNVSLFDDDGFTLEHFIELNTETSNEDYFDYSVQINNVFAPINEAISRLSDLEKIPYRVEEVSISNGEVDLSNLNYKCKEVMNVATTDLERLPFIPFGINKIKITRPKPATAVSVFGNDIENNKVLVEYKEDIPYFTREDMVSSVDVETSKVVWNEDEIELADYGITNSMCNYIIEYAKGVLMEQIDASLANMHITRAEQYFNNIRIVGQALNQTNVYKTNKVGW